MVTEDQEPALELSDVVHEETMSSHGDISSPIDIPIDPELLDLPHVTSSLDYPTISDTDGSSPSSYNLAAHLEREMASYLQEDALDESSPEDNDDSGRQHEDDTAERHPQGANERRDASPGDSAEEDIMSIGGLAAFLQAAHARAEDKENRGDGYHYEVSHEGLTRRHQAQDSVKMTTRAVPAFHSLNVDSANSGPSTPTTAIHDKYSELNMTDILYGHNAHEPPSHSGHINSDNPPDVPSFGDIDELLHDLSDFEHHPDDHEDPPTPPSHPPQAPPRRYPMYYASSDEDENVDQLLPSSPIIEPKKLAEASAPSTKSSSAKEGGSREHVCEACSKTFTRRSDVSRHMRIHTGERPFVCPEPGCERTFIQRSALLVHQRTHSGEKPHICEYPGCNKTFSDSSSLARHRRTHTGKRPYQCEDPACDKTFTRRTSLTTHMKTHDPTWEPDPNKKYSFKAKRPKLGPAVSGLALAGPMHAVSALLHPDGTGHAASSSAVLSAPTITTINSEIAAVWAQTRLETNEEEDEEDEDESGSESDSGPGEDIVPQTSGIRGERGPPMIGNTRPAARTSPVPLLPPVEEEDEEFPIPLRTRKGKEPVGVAGVKRKR